MEDRLDRAGTEGRSPVKRMLWLTLRRQEGPRGLPGASEPASLPWPFWRGAIQESPPPPTSLSFLLRGSAIRRL